MQDGQLEVREGHTVPVLAQPSTHRLIVLNSTALGHMHLANTEPLPIPLEAIDRLALIARYIEGTEDL
jgi:hypothetical protein